MKNDNAKIATLEAQIKELADDMQEVSATLAVKLEDSSHDAKRLLEVQSENTSLRSDLALAREALGKAEKEIEEWKEKWQELKYDAMGEDL